MSSETVYLGLGSNIGDSFSIVKRAFLAISNIPHVNLLKTSRLYSTSPVSDIPQGDYINAVCKLQTTLGAEELFAALCKVETQLGKRPKHKNAPREIDIDILFFGTQYCKTDQLEIPHPRWKQRLFVLAPLKDLTGEITYPVGGEGTTETASLEELIAAFASTDNQRVLALNQIGDWDHH
jgi:2-amino-4-hydroxy-6-hydroxymethyldihydropteridine diphosphokinase